MARRERLANGAETTLNGAITSVATSLIVASASKFPTEGDFRIIIDSELILVTVVAGNTFTIVRSIESTSAASHSNGVDVAQVVTEANMKRLIEESIDPFAFLRPAYRVQDTNGDFLTASDFTWVNQGTATRLDQGSSIITITDDDSVGQNIRALVRSAPSTPYTITAAILRSLVADSGSTGPLAGICFRENSTDDFLTLLNQPGNADSLRILKYASVTSVPSLGLNLEAGVLSLPFWMKMEDDGTNVKFHVSQDGFNFTQVYSALRGDDFTGSGPDEVGFLLNNIGGIDGNFMSLVAWDGE